MSSLKTLTAALIAAHFASPIVAGTDLTRTFASCAGRLSAVMEHQWLMSDPGAKVTEIRRQTMISLLEAVINAGQGREVLNWRIDAKQAQSVLLTRATFNDDPADAHWAHTRAETELAACTGLLTG